MEIGGSRVIQSPTYTYLTFNLNGPQVAPRATRRNPDKNSLNGLIITRIMAAPKARLLLASAEWEPRPVCTGYFQADCLGALIVAIRPTYGREQTIPERSRCFSLGIKVGTSATTPCTCPLHLCAMSSPRVCLSCIVPSPL